MTEFIPKVVNYESCVRQFRGKQDLAFCFKLEKEDGWTREEGDEDINVIACLDGHGHDVIPNILRNMYFKPHFIKENPIESIQQELDTNIKEYLTTQQWRSDDTLNSGSTMSFAKIYRNDLTKKVIIKLEWMGDSPILVFVNGELVFENNLHSANNTDEVYYLRTRGLDIQIEQTTSGFKVISEKEIKSLYGKYLKYGYMNNNLLAVTRSLGHNRKLPLFESEKHIIECSSDDDVRVLILSDGVSDLVKKEFDFDKLNTFTAEQLVDLAEARWKQEWIYVKNEVKKPYKLSASGYDDCCCALWNQRSIVFRRPLEETSITNE